MQRGFHSYIVLSYVQRPKSPMLTTLLLLGNVNMECISEYFFDYIPNL